MNKYEEIIARGPVMSPEQALKDLEGWFKYKRITPRVREKDTNSRAEEILLDGLQDGLVVIEDDMRIRQSLLFPTGENEEGVTELVFRPRMSVDQRAQAVKGLKPEDGEGRMVGYAAFLTDQPRGVIKQLDPVDYDIVQSIVTYFL